MLAIRMQRTGRKGHAMFRVVVQDSRRTPTSGKVVAQLGSYDPHAKTVTLDKEKASFYLKNGAQPSARVAKLLQTEGVKLPDWVDVSAAKASKVRHLDKLRRNRPPEAKQAEEVVAETPAEESAAEETTPETAATEATTAEPETTEAPENEVAAAEETPAAETEKA